MHEPMYIKFSKAGFKIKRKLYIASGSVSPTPQRKILGSLASRDMKSGYFADQGFGSKSPIKQQV